MNTRGELEIVINTRWVERGFWLLVIAAVAGFFLWQSSQNSYTGAAEDLARIAELETTLVQKEDDLSAMRVQIAILEARIEDLKTPASAPAPTTPTTPPPLADCVPSNFRTAWSYSGAHVSNNQYRLSDVTIDVTSTCSKNAALRYELCWSTIECERVVTKGTFTAMANGSTAHDVTITIPRFVDTSATQRLKLSIYEGTNVLDSSERVIQ